MEISSKEEGRALRIFLKGELDHHGAKSVMEELDYLFDAALPKALTMDFAAVSFMDSSGIAVVLKAQRRMNATGGNVTLVNVSPQIKRIFDLAGLSRVVTIR